MLTILLKLFTLSFLLPLTLIIGSFVYYAKHHLEFLYSLQDAKILSTETTTIISTLFYFSFSYLSKISLLLPLSFFLLIASWLYSEFPISKNIQNFSRFILNSLLGLSALTTLAAFILFLFVPNTNALILLHESFGGIIIYFFVFIMAAFRIFILGEGVFS